MKTYCLNTEQQIALIRTWPGAVGIRINPDHVDAGKVFDAIRGGDGVLGQDIGIDYHEGQHLMQPNGRQILQ